MVERGGEEEEEEYLGGLCGEIGQCDYLCPSSANCCRSKLGSPPTHPIGTGTQALFSLMIIFQRDSFRVLEKNIPGL